MRHIAVAMYRSSLCYTKEVAYVSLWGCNGACSHAVPGLGGRRGGVSRRIARIDRGTVRFCGTASRPRVVVVEHPAPHETYDACRVPLVMHSLGGHAVGRPSPAGARPPWPYGCPGRRP